MERSGGYIYFSALFYVEKTELIKFSMKYGYSRNKNFTVFSINELNS